MTPLIGWQVSPAGPGHPATGDTHPAAGYERARGIIARFDAQTGSGLIFNPESSLLHVVNLAGWVAFNLCEGQDLSALRRSYAGVTASKLPSADAAKNLDIALTQLREAGLIKPVINHAVS